MAYETRGINSDIGLARLGLLGGAGIDGPRDPVIAKEREVTVDRWVKFGEVDLERAAGRQQFARELTVTGLEGVLPFGDILMAPLDDPFLVEIEFQV